MPIATLRSQTLHGAGGVGRLATPGDPTGPRQGPVKAVGPMNDSALERVSSESIPSERAEIDRSFEVATDRRTVTLAAEVKGSLTAVRNDLEVVGGLSPGLLFPAARDAARTERIRTPA